MGYSWQIKPKDSMVVPILQYAPAGVQNITIGRVKELLTAKGFNAAILSQTTQGGYTGYIVITKFGNINSDLHLGTDIYFGKDKYNIGFTKPLSGTIPQTWFYVISSDGNSLVSQTGMEWNGFAQSQTVDGVEYYVTKDASVSAYKKIYITTYTGNIYYHGDIPINYDWESVRSVEGKGKTYKLTKYLNINNGEPVNNVSYENNVDVSSKSKVNNMVSDVIIYGDKVTVNYTIPAGSYSYIKLVYKKDSIPASYTDGTAIDITQSSTSKVINGIADGGVYWFIIFTDKSSSEPKYINTIKAPVQTLLDTSDAFVSEYINSYVSYCDVYAGYYIEDYTLRRGTAQTPNGTSAYCTNSKFLKGNATKMYVEMEAKNALSRSKLYVKLYKNKITQDAWFSPETYYIENIITTGSTNLPKTTIEVPLENVGDNAFYIGFHCADVNLFITKISFDSPVAVIGD